jgi:Domain of unknown function (DUF4157)
MPARTSGRTNSALLQRRCTCGATPGMSGECQECRKKAARLRRSSGHSHSNTVPPIVHEVLETPGTPLDRPTRVFMERRFGHDFGKVNIHADFRAGESARAIGAMAYTVRKDIVFGHKQYAPGTAEGMRLIAHELTHTIQQGPNSFAPLAVASPDNGEEKQAEASAAAILAGRSVDCSLATPGSGPAAIARDVARPEPKTPPVEAPPSHGEQPSAGGEAPSCTPAPGYSPSGHCFAYGANAWWLPLAYVNNATCACLTTPDVPTANCVRKFLQDRLAATPGWLKALAAAEKAQEINPVTYPAYQAFVQTVLTPRIYQDHVDAYRSCCCPFGPAAYPDWIAVTTVPIQPCSLVGWFIDHFGSCTGTPGAW